MKTSGTFDKKKKIIFRLLYNNYFVKNYFSKVKLTFYMDQTYLI